MKVTYFLADHATKKETDVEADRYETTAGLFKFYQRGVLVDIFAQEDIAKIEVNR